MHKDRAVSVQEEGAMDSENTGWMWVVRGVVESFVLLVGLSLLGSLAVTLLG
jgi:hypothetical protein